MKIAFRPGPIPRRGDRRTQLKSAPAALLVQGYCRVAMVDAGPEADALPPGKRAKAEEMRRVHMQLKRDTEYALRVLFCVGRQTPEGGAARGLTLGEISAAAGVPRVSADRICAALERAALLESRRGAAGEQVYAPGQDFARRSLLDVMRVTEHGAQHECSSTLSMAHPPL